MHYFGYLYLELYIIKIYKKSEYYDKNVKSKFRINLYLLAYIILIIRI